MERVNAPDMFNGRALCLFYLDESYQAFESTSRHFSSAPAWFDLKIMKNIALHYGNKLRNQMPLGYRNGQLFLAFSHNTPDNAPPIFWDEGLNAPWAPLFLRYDKNYTHI